MLDTDSWAVGDVRLASRFLLGTAGYPSPQVLADTMAASGAQVVTVGLKRQLAAGGDNGFIDIIRQAMRQHVARLLPNTAGCTSAREAVQLAHPGRDRRGTGIAPTHGRTPRPRRRRTRRCSSPRTRRSGATRPT